MKRPPGRISQTVNRLFWPLAVGAAVCGCAEIKPPPGGEIDQTAPRLLESYPPDSALGISPGREITLTFSERLVKPDKGTGVFISPRPEVAPDIRWKSDRIIIQLAQPFQPEQTYVVTVTPDVADLRRNRLDSAIMIAFSTGQHIDSASAGGQVLTTDGKPAANWAVGLYHDLTFPDSSRSDSLYPAYQTTTNREGNFSFRYLPDRAYRLLAFNDKNRDDLFNPAADDFAVPDRAIETGGELPLDRLILPGTRYDSLAPKVISAVGTSDGLVRVRLSRAIDANLLGREPDRMALTSLIPENTSIRAEGIIEADTDETALLSAYFPQLPEGLYRLEVAYASDRPPLTHDSLHYKVQADKSPPTVVEVKPANRPHFADQIVLRHTFSEPLDTLRLSEQTFVLWEDETAIVPTTPVWRDCFRLVLEPERLLAGHRYRLDVTEFDLVDLSGQTLGDSLRSYPFSTLDSDSLGSISGEVSINLPVRERDPAQLFFRNTANGREFDITVNPPGRAEGEVRRLFAVDIPPGKYLLSGFLDSNRDGKPTAGGIRPFRLAETRMFYADTIAVRARFETAGIELVVD